MLGAAGMIGAMAAVAIVMILAPAAVGASGYGPVVAAMAKIAAWIIGPSVVLTVISGLLAIAAHAPFQDAGWVWVKAATGILVLEGAVHVLGPIQEAAKRGAGALAAGPDPAALALLLTSEANTMWVLIAVSAANVALAVWRPRLPQYPV
jgi:hypothetical protein